jgi:hypothetical protein
MKAILKEGGNMFADAVEFDHSQISAILKQVNGIMSATRAKLIPIGSGATPTAGKKSGDLDVIVDQDILAQHFNAKDAKGAKAGLEQLFNQAGLDTKKSGTIVHVRVPIEGGSAQVDIMVVPHAEMISKYHIHDIPAGSPYKGLNKQLAMAKLAKDQGMKWSAFKGLLNRADDAMVATDLDEIAKILIGPNATAKDLGSVESIVKALGPKGAQLLADLKADPNWKEVAPKTESLADKHLNRIRELSGVLLNHSSMSSGAFNR